MVPNVVTYNALLSARARGKQLERALDIFLSMRREAVMCDIVTHNALISSCEKGG